MKFSALFKILSFFLVFIVFLLLSKDIAIAQAPAYSKTDIEEEANQEINELTGIITSGVISYLSCQITGADPSMPEKECSGLGNGDKRGLIGIMDGLITATLSPPISSGEYLAYLRSNFGLAKGAHAAQLHTCARDTRGGFGFCSLQPITSLWIGMRNVVYMIFILVFVVIGLGIMFRLHIDPRTVMTIQNQIPKIIMGVILVTFSFAIAGFLIDIMFVASYLFANVITSSAGEVSSLTAQTIITAPNPFDAANKALAPQGGAGGVVFPVAKAFTELINSVFFGPSGDNIFVNAYGEIDIIGGILKGIFSIFIGGLSYLVLAIAVVVVLVRLWIILVLAYINIIIDIIFAPFWIIAGLLPGSSLGLGAWFRDLIANLAVFPVTISFLLIANILMSQFGGTADVKQFVPPLLGGVDSDALAALIGFGFLLMLPNLLKTVKAAFKAPKIDYGPLYGPVGAGTGTVAGVGKETLGLYRGTKGPVRIQSIDPKTGTVGYDKKPIGWTGAIKSRFGFEPK